MVVANFGMGYRPNSEVVKTDDQVKYELDKFLDSINWQRNLQVGKSNDALDAYGLARVNQARSQGFNVGDDYADIVRRAASNKGINFSTDSRNFNADIGDAARAAGSAFALSQQRIGRLDDAGSRTAADARGLLDARSNALDAQQTAYNANQIGTPGGVLPGISHQGTLDPTQAASWNTPWMQPGFGNPGSLGGLGGYNPQNGQNGQQQSGWGGVFGNKNPWSMA